MNALTTKINRKEVYILVQEIDLKIMGIGHLKLLIEKNLKSLFAKNMVTPRLEVFKTSNQKNLIVHIRRTKNILFLKERHIDFFNKKTCLPEIKNAIYSAGKQAKQNHKMSEEIPKDISKVLAHQNFQNQN